MLLHYLVKLKTRKLYLFTEMFRVDLPIDTQDTSELSPNNCWTIFHSKSDRMCAPNKTKKGNTAFSCLFRSHLLITISVMVSGRLGAMSRIGSFSSSSMNCMSMDSITGVFYHLNKMLIATKHIVDNNFVVQ